MATSERVLRRHVRESNLIESITARHGTPLYDSHLKAARLADTGEIIHPNIIHGVLADGVAGMESFKGKYRTRRVSVVTRVGGVIVDSISMPRPEEVPRLMSEWEGLVREFVAEKEVDEYVPELLHTWFVCIHPYRDGNGRTARLMWNMLRRNKGLPWHIQPSATKQEYYDRIREIQIKVFKRRHFDVY